MAFETSRDDQGRNRPHCPRRVNALGVRELRLTGGEPLVRADLVDIIAGIRNDHPDLPPISMTTNGVGLDKKAAALKAAGLTRINVSLDSLHEETFTKLTRRPPFLDRVLAGVDAAWAAGLGPVKLNAVLMRGINDAESPDLLAWALGRGYELRFIEQMPLDADHGWTRRNMITAAEIRELLSRDFVLDNDPPVSGMAHQPSALKYDAGTRQRAWLRVRSSVQWASSPPSLSRSVPTAAVPGSLLRARS